MRFNYLSLLYLSGILSLFILGCDLDPSPQKRDFTDKKREVFVLNNLAETVSVYHPDTRTNYNDVFTTGQAPNDLLFYRDTLFIVCSLDNTIEVYNETSFEQIAQIYLGPGNNPYSIFAGEGSYVELAFVPNWLSNTVTVVNLKTLQTEATIDEALSRPQDGAIIENYLFVCNTANDGSSIGEGSISIYDIDNSYQYVDSVDTGDGSNPQTALALPAKEELHVYLTGNQSADDGEVLILDVSPLLNNGERPTETSCLSIGGSPSYTGTAYDSTSGSVYLTGTYGLYSYNAHNASMPSDNPIKSLNDPTGELYAGVVVDTDDNTLLITNFGGDSLLLLDAQNEYNLIDSLQASDGPVNPTLIIE